MPTETINLYATETATLHQGQPTQSFYNENPTALNIEGKPARYEKQDQLFVKFDSINPIYLSKRYVETSFYFYIERYPTEINSRWCMIWLLPKNYSIDDRSYAADSQSMFDLQGWHTQDLISVKIGWVSIRFLSAQIKDLLNGIGFQFLSFSYSDDGSYVLTASGSAANRPYLSVVIDDPNIDIILEPASGFVDEKKQNIFSWEWETDSIGGSDALNANETTLEWKNGSDGEIQTIKIPYGTESYTFPANTFPETSSLLWRVTIDFDEGYQASSAWATLTTIDKKPTVENLSPKSIYIDGSIENKFEWDYVVDTGSAQYGATLEYSADNGLMWEPLGTVSGGNTYYLVPANTLPAGSILWRVKATNSDGVDSEWSENAAIVVRSAPPPPIISVTDVSPRPSIEWQSVGQQAFRVIAGDYDSGDVYGTTKKYKIPHFLPDGKTEIKVRIQNAFGVWSDWATTAITIQNKPVGKIFLKAISRSHNIKLIWESETIEGSPIYYIYRDGKLIGKSAGTSYLDELACGVHEYQVRGAVGDNYSMSNTWAARLDIKTACIAEYGVWNWLELPVVRGRLPSLSTQYTGNVTYLHFAGRALPVAEIGEERDVSWSFAFSTTNRECAERMASLFARLVVYKDPRDGACVGVLEGQSRQSDRYGWDFSYTIRAVDHKEVVTYDV